MNRAFQLVSAAAGLVVGAGVSWVGLQPAGNQGKTPNQPAGERSQPPGSGFPDLTGSLRDSPGCLGVESARTTSGKNVIFAWFKDKASVVEWYDNPKHQGPARRFFGPSDPAFKPLTDVPDDSGPLMVIASITFSEKPEFKESNLPISQIAIEIYQPVTGGIFLGGRFAPDEVKVKGMRDYSAPAPAARP